MAEARRFNTYDDFFAYYMSQHRRPANRWLHALGTFVGLAAIIIAAALGKYWWAFLWIPVGYGFSWSGHFLVERNKPATFGHPFWSLISDFRMLGLMLTGRLSPWLETGRDQQAAD